MTNGKTKPPQGTINSLDNVQGTGDGDGEERPRPGKHHLNRAIRDNPRVRQDKVHPSPQPLDHAVTSEGSAEGVSQAPIDSNMRAPCRTTIPGSAQVTRSAPAGAGQTRVAKAISAVNPRNREAGVVRFRRHGNANLTGINGVRTRAATGLHEPVETLPARQVEIRINRAGPMHRRSGSNVVSSQPAPDQGNRMETNVNMMDRIRRSSVPAVRCAAHDVMTRRQSA